MNLYQDILSMFGNVDSLFSDAIYPALAGQGIKGTGRKGRNVMDLLINSFWLSLIQKLASLLVNYNQDLLNFWECCRASLLFFFSRSSTWDGSKSSGC